MTLIDKETMNVLRVSASMMIFFTAVLSFEFIEEPLIGGLAEAGIGGIEKRDGYLCLCLVYLFNTLSCFFTPFVVTRMSGKWTMAMGMITVIIFQVSFLFPMRVLLLFTSALTGVGATFFWVGQGQYITENVSEKNMEKNTSIQWGLFKTSLIYGGIIFIIFFQQQSIRGVIDDGKVPIFMAVFIFCSLVALLNTVLLPQSEMSQNRLKQPFFKASADCLKLMKTQRIICISVFFLYTGFVRSFWISIYPACIKFTSVLATNTTILLAIGMIVTGCGQVIGSVFVTIVGRRIRKHGKHLLIVFALSLHICLFVVISLCFPNDAPLGPTEKAGPVFKATGSVAMIISGMLGFGDAILQTQVYAYIAEHYQKESGSVFSIFRFFSGIASTIMFFSAQFIPLVGHLSILTTSALAAGFAIFAIQKINKKKESESSAIAVPVFHTRSSMDSSRL